MPSRSSIGVVGVCEGVEARARKLLRRVAGEVAERRVDAHDAPDVVRQRHPDRRAVEGAAKELLGGGQLGQLRLAGADVADRAGDEHALVGLQRTEADLDRELAAVLAQPVELELATHRSRDGVADIALDVVAMLPAQPLGDQLGDVLADELLAAIAEHALGLRVDELDVTMAVDDHHGVRRRLEQPAELLLGAPQQSVAAHQAAHDGVVGAAQPVQQPAQELADGDHRRPRPCMPGRQRRCRVAPVRLLLELQHEVALAEVAKQRPVREALEVRRGVAPRIGIHERHVLVGEARHRAADADAAGVGAAADAVHPAALRDVADRRWALAAELDEAARIAAVRRRELPLLGEAGAAAALARRARVQTGRPQTVVELWRRREATGKQDELEQDRGHVVGLCRTPWDADDRHPKRGSARTSPGSRAGPSHRSGCCASPGRHHRWRRCRRRRLPLPSAPSGRSTR